MTTKLISREPTEEMLRIGYEAAAFPRDAEICVAMFKAMFDAAPAINPWVGVKERLPKDDGLYVCLTIGRKLISQGLFKKRDTVSHKAMFISDSGQSVKYWWDEFILPIPRPEE